MAEPRMFIVDVEAAGRTPYSGRMTEFGVVDFTTRDWFHGHLWPSTPDPKTPAIPVIAPDAKETYRYALGNRLEAEGPPADLPDLGDLMSQLWDWLDSRTRGERAVFVSDNPAFDFMWIADAFDRVGVQNKFGHTGRRIGDLAAGLDGKWLQTSKWKRLRKTRHDHNPVNDALGNAEALDALLRKHNQLS